LPAMLERAARICRHDDAAAPHGGHGGHGGLSFVDRHERLQSFSWDEIRVRARSVAGALQKLGVRRGDRVALLFPTSPEFFDAFFGVALAGGVPVPLYPPVRLG